MTHESWHDSRYSWRNLPVLGLNQRLGPCDSTRLGTRPNCLALLYNIILQRSNTKTKHCNLLKAMRCHQFVSIEHIGFHVPQCVFVSLCDCYVVSKTMAVEFYINCMTCVPRQYRNSVELWERDDVSNSCRSRLSLAAAAAAAAASWWFAPVWHTLGAKWAARSRGVRHFSCYLADRHCILLTRLENV